MQGHSAMQIPTNPHGKKWFASKLDKLGQEVFMQRCRQGIFGGVKVIPKDQAEKIQNQNPDYTVFKSLELQDFALVYIETGRSAPCKHAVNCFDFKKLSAKRRRAILCRAWSRQTTRLHAKFPRMRRSQLNNRLWKQKFHLRTDKLNYHHQEMCEEQGCISESQ